MSEGMTAAHAVSRPAECPLSGHHAVVTGGGSGIGGAIADTLARLGADLTIMGRRRPVLEVHAATLARRHGTRIEAVALDVAQQESVETAFRIASERLGHPAILVNNAGLAKAAPFSKTDPAMWQEVIEVDLSGAYLCIRQTLPYMIKNGYGRVVNIASTAGLTGYPYVAAYCAAKHGLIGLTRALARETARTAVTVNAVCPGYTDTAIVETAVTSISAKTGRARAGLGRAGGPQSAGTSDPASRGGRDGRLAVSTKFRLDHGSEHLGRRWRTDVIECTVAK